MVRITSLLTPQTKIRGKPLASTCICRPAAVWALTIQAVRTGQSSSRLTPPDRAGGRMVSQLDVTDLAAGRAVIQQTTSSNPNCGSPLQNKLSSQLGSNFLSPYTEPDQQFISTRASPFN
ncbi:unnamed protein product [Schistocephalus solidus]|uniref:Uncharacterized protein n=1 Tax=Schistocephalus solidus TaxID=70667 RepID=A0A183SY81_SCHSO|nr:unnamed protein product [Schistocephalus solidus]